MVHCSQFDDVLCIVLTISPHHMVFWLQSFGAKTLCLVLIQWHNTFLLESYSLFNCNLIRVEDVINPCFSNNIKLYRDLFRTLSNIDDGAFFEDFNGWKIFSWKGSIIHLKQIPKYASAVFFWLTFIRSRTWRSFLVQQLPQFSEVRLKTFLTIFQKALAFFRLFV